MLTDYFRCQGLGATFLRLPQIFPFIYRKSRIQEDTTVDHADIRGLVPTFLASVGCLPPSRDESTFRPLHAAEGSTTPGLRLFRERLETLQACASTRRHLYAVGDPAPCLAMAHRKARNARAMATTTCLALLPLAMS